MAIANWLARALARSKVVTLTPGGTIEVGDLFNVTINGKTVSYPATGTTVASVCTGLAAALTASEIAEFAAITWEDDTTTVTGTGTAGVNFTVTVETTESNGGAADAQTFVLATPTTATGPNNWNDINNWDTGAVPVNGDTANIDLALGSILDGLDQSAVTLAELNIFASTRTTNTIGLPKINAGGWTEYLDDYLNIGATLCVCSVDSPRVKLNFGSVLNTTEARLTGNPADGTTPALLITGTHVSNAFDIQSGTVGLAYYEGESYASASVKGVAGSTIIGGSGADSDEIRTGGSLLWSGTFDDLICDGGQAEILGTPSGDLIDVSGGGILLAKFGGNIAAVSVGGTLGGTIDAQFDRTPRTFETLTLNEGGKVFDPGETITIDALARGTGVRELQAA